MITIGRPSVNVKNGKARLSAAIEKDDEKSSLWFEVEEEYAPFLCEERSDAFLLGVLHYAMRYGHDIVCEAPVTERLLEQLTKNFLPCFMKANTASRVGYVKGQGWWPVHITAEQAEEVAHPSGGRIVGTGCSCGVDSLHVYACHDDIDYGCVWNAHALVSGETDEQRSQSFADMVCRASAFLRHIGRKILVGDTNFDRGCFIDLTWDGFTTSGNLFCCFALQKMWRKFYIASGYDINNYSLKLPLTGDPSHYEYFLAMTCAMSNILIQIDGAHLSRMEKVKRILDYPPTGKFLNVCLRMEAGHKNCTYRCAKCIRTLLEIYCIGGLHKVKEVFDVQFFTKNMHIFLAEYYVGILRKDAFLCELKPFLTVDVITKIKAFCFVFKRFIKSISRRLKD